MGDEALQRQVLGLFLDHMAEKSPQLEDAGEDLAKLAHSIKGVCQGDRSLAGGKLCGKPSKRLPVTAGTRLLR